MWEWSIKQNAYLWSEFYKYWIDLAKNKKIPVIFIRYEDLAANNFDSMKEVISFMLGMESIEGTYVEQRIKDVLA